MTKFKKPKPFSGVVVENQELPFETLAYATTDVDLGKEEIILYGTTEFVDEITKKMNEKREFEGSNIFPASKRSLVNEFLGAIAEKSKIIEDLGNGKYRAKETVYVRRGRFAATALVGLSGAAGPEDVDSPSLCGSS